MWTNRVKEELLRQSTIDIVICPPYILIPKISQEFRGSPVQIGAQDVSRYDFGAYTGEVTAAMLSSFCSFCIVGHSERKKYFGESVGDVSEKIRNLLKFAITPILCVGDMNELAKYIKTEPAILKEKDKIIFVYEPPQAISQPGEYNSEDPQTAQKVADNFREGLGEIQVLYGGSVNSENVSAFLNLENIDGVLTGQASWEAETFLSLIKRALS